VTGHSYTPIAMFSETLQSVIGFKSQEDFNAFKKKNTYFYNKLWLKLFVRFSDTEVYLDVQAEMTAAIEEHKLHWVAKAEIDKQQKKKIKAETAIVTKSLLATARVNTHGDVGSLAVLHEDIIFRILKYFAIHELYGCIMLVSKAFYSLVTHMSFDDYVVDFRRAMRINKFNVTTFLKVLNRFKSNQQDVKQLVIGYIKYTDKTFDKIAVACPNLTHLTIDTIRGKYVRKMTQLGFSALKNMKIHSYTQKGCALSEEKYIDIVRSIGESLTHLDIERIYCGNFFLVLAKCAPNLLSVKLSGAISLDDDGVKALLAGCKKIETFELDTSRTYPKKVFLPESVRNTLTNAIKNVVILDFIEPTPY
jgi:hypothetical protein